MIKALEEFVKIEESRMTKTDKFWGDYPKLKTTQQLAYTWKNKTLEHETILKPPASRRYAWVFILFIGGLWLLLPMRSSIGWGAFFILAGCVTIAAFIVYKKLSDPGFNPKRIFTVVLTNRFIEIKGRRAFWKDIQEVYIMTRMVGKMFTFYLIVVGRNDSMEVHDFYEFAISANEMASYVEYYRSRADDM